MSLETKRIKELFGYARTLTKEQGVGAMAAAGGRVSLSGASSANGPATCPPSKRWTPSVRTPNKTPKTGRLSGYFDAAVQHAAETS